MPCCFAIPLLILSLLVPESPRWLLEEKLSHEKFKVSLQAGR